MSEGEYLQRLKATIDALPPGSSQDKAARKELAEALGSIIRELREQRGWSVHRLAKKADCNMSAVHHLEQGVNLPGRPLLRRLAWALGQGESE